MSAPESFELHLVKSKEDSDIFSPEYQRELGRFSRGAHATSQRCFAMDSAVGGGGPLGEFIFNNAAALITAYNRCMRMDKGTERKKNSHKN
ncbi:hypothetical protein [Stutzerimonas decontaminans]|uniref:hypothetical protein n=1 Tax=Stutzerimonas decontaminans TaxID=3022791 RepID=UPI000AACC147|nr:hypothetical protein [Stutzerimonas decontaminans]MCQ4247044.1 hypothetical protein [Stutzerimonas decontaminans]